MSVIEDKDTKNFSTGSVSRLLQTNIRKSASSSPQLFTQFHISQNSTAFAQVNCLYGDTILSALGTLSFNHYSKSMREIFLPLL